MSQARERLLETLQELGIMAKRSLGQNFLVSDVVISRIIEKVTSLAPDELIEVGPGPGALTYFLRQMQKPLTVIELDRVIAEYWKNQGLNVIEDDALKLDWSSFYTPGKRLVFVSNLPYQISSSIVIERSLESEGAEAMVLMFQKEVAQRIRASAKTEAYGLLSVIAQTFWKTEVVSEAGPRDFDPPPRVASRVLAFQRVPCDIANREDFLKFTKAAFAQRRKLLKKNLSDIVHRKKLTEMDLIGWLKEMGLPETARAEELSPSQFQVLYKKFGFE